MNRNLADKFGPRIKRNTKIEEKVGNMRLCFWCFNDLSYISLEHNGETYAFSFDYRIKPNDLYAKIRKKAKKRNQEPTPGYENFTWYKAKLLIGCLRKCRSKNYI